MSTTKTFAGQSFNLPLNREPKSSNWGTETSNFLIAVADNAIPKTGGSYTLSAELNLGATYGVLAPYLKSAGTNPAAAGVVRLAKTETVSWRNNANGADLALGIDGSDRLTFGSSGPVAYLGSKLSAFAATTSAELKTVISDETGSGALVFASSPALTTPDLGTPSAITLTSATGLPLSTGVTGVLAAANGGTGVANNAASTLAISGNFGTTLTVTGTTALTLPTSGTLSTLAGAEALTNKSLTADGASRTAFVSATGTGRKVVFDVSGATDSTTTTIFAAQTGGRNITLPNSSGTLALTSAPQFSSNVDILAGGELRLYNSGNTFYTGFKGGSAAANKIWTLPLVDGSADQLLKTDGSGALGWVSPLTNPMTAAQDLIVGGSAGAATRLATPLLGDVQVVTPSSQAYTVTSAAPGVFTVTAHGYSTGDKVYLTATQNGFTLNTTYYVNKTAANTFTLCTTLANAVAGTGITSSGTTAGTIVGGGLVLTSGTKGTVTNDSATAGYVGEYISSSVTGNVSGSSTIGTYTDTGASIALTPGDWDVRVIATVEHDFSTGTGALAGILALTDNANTIQVSQVGASAGSGAIGYSPFGFTYRLSIASATTYKLRFSTFTTSGSPATVSTTLAAGTGRPCLLAARRVR